MNYKKVIDLIISELCEWGFDDPDKFVYYLDGIFNGISASEKPIECETEDKWIPDIKSMPSTLNTDNPNVEELKVHILGKPVYKKGDKVKFKFADEDEKEGEIAIVDAYGTFEQSEQPSYDIWGVQVNGEKCLYKHVLESTITGYAKDDDIDPAWWMDCKLP